MRFQEISKYIFNNKHKKMVPGRADIEKWKNDLHSKGITLSGYFLELYKRLLGEEHLLVANSLNNLVLRSGNNPPVF